MATYTVHEPPLREDESAPDPGRFVFVRDGFYFWAFLLAPLWMLRRRLWLVLLAYLVVVAALNLGMIVAGASATVMFLVDALLSLLIGLEAASLRRFTLNRRGWSHVGVVVGDNRELAERRFFDAWATGEARRPPPMSAIMPSGSSVPAMRRQPDDSSVIGLFPAPGTPR
jgi:hypothetical protein